MAKSGCRDCSRCTESAVTGCMMLPFRFLAGFVRVFTRPFVKMCPACHHPLAWHAKRQDGSFKD